MRGNPTTGRVYNSQQGSIPACAGEPSYDANATHALMVYPRVCGGTSLVHDKRDNWLGLSPRVRGNRGLCAFPIDGRRSIPACAGEPFQRRFQIRKRRVYPRVCGGTVLPRS